MGGPSSGGSHVKPLERDRGPFASICFTAYMYCIMTKGVTAAFYCEQDGNSTSTPTVHEMPVVVAQPSKRYLVDAPKESEA